MAVMMTTLSDDGFSVAKFFRGRPTGRFFAGGDNDSVD